MPCYIKDYDLIIKIKGKTPLTIKNEILTKLKQK